MTQPIEHDGIVGTPIVPAPGGKPEFGSDTTVIYVNGINTPLGQEQQDAQRYANITHDRVELIHAATFGMESDLARCAKEKLNLTSDPAEAAVATQVLERVHGGEMTGNLHFMAHSRGALIVQRGLEQAEAHLASEGVSPAAIRGVLAHISVETAGGASLGMPDGVRCVHYIDPHDSVANVFGQGEPSRKDLLVMDIAAGSMPMSPIGLGELGYIAAKPLLTHPNGPVVSIPVAPAAPGALGDLLANHAIDHYLQYRQPFETTYAAWEAAHPHHAAQRAERHAENVLHGPAELAERDYLTNVAEGRAQSGVTELAQFGVDAQRAAGRSLPDVASVTPSQQRNQSGTFVAVDERTVAQHTGRGAYQVFDVPRDLHDLMPPLGQTVDVTRSGEIALANPAGGIARD